MVAHTHAPETAPKVVRQPGESAAGPAQDSRAAHHLLRNRDQLTFKELVQLFWYDRWLIVCATIGLMVGAAAAALLLPKSYDAVTVISPIGEEPGGGGMGGLSSLASQFGGLASLAGISVTGDTRKAESIAVLQSDVITERFIRDHDLLPVLYWRKWNPATKTWNVSDPSDKPTLWKAMRYFERSIVSVSTDAKSGLVTLTVTWRDPAVAAQWANGLVDLTNDYLRGKALAESQRHIQYLTEQAAKTDSVAVRQTIYMLLEGEIDNAMIAQGTDQYAFKVLDPAIAQEKAAFPRPLLWTALGGVCGFILALIAALIRAQWRAVD
jgi:uncharacterized protein involved in exopolysaccharide biosynthesis